MTSTDETSFFESWEVSRAALVARMASTLRHLGYLAPSYSRLDGFALARTLVDHVITFAWISADPKERHGLGAMHLAMWGFRAAWRNVRDESVRTTFLAQVQADDEAAIGRRIAAEPAALTLSTLGAATPPWVSPNASRRRSILTVRRNRHLPDPRLPG